MLNTIGIGPQIHRNPSEFTGRNSVHPREVLEGVMVGCRSAKEKEELKYCSLSFWDEAVAPAHCEFWYTKICWHEPWDTLNPSS